MASDLKLVQGRVFTAVAVLALLLAPGLFFLSVQGLAQTPAKTPAKDDKSSKDGEVKKILDRAKQMQTEGGRHAAAAEAALEDEKKAASDKKSAGAAGTTAPARTAPVRQSPVTDQRDKGDPFAIPVKPVAPETAAAARPSGQTGLVVAEVELQGLVKATNGNVAIVRAPNGFVYFLKANDKIYNARVLKVTDDALYFEETVVDALGRSTKREVAKRLAPAPPSARQ